MSVAPELPKTALKPAEGEAAKTAPPAPAPSPSPPTPAPTPPVVEAHEAPILDHEYDGIQEYDNPLPGWWVWIFWVTIAFTPLYIAYYHYGEGPLVADEYARDLRAHQEAEARRALESGAVDEASLAALVADAATLAQGEAVFRTNCVACHGDQGEGRIGPNLTDDYWLHGGELMSIFRVIDEGVPDKGMIAWGKMLGPDDIKRVTAFVGAMRGKNVPGLGPQGERAGSK
ncbi:MAG: c-type cytochrome [Planctomycetota bacterium]|nr:c-type cytochrome [Planctomycetota bacterium]